MYTFKNGISGARQQGYTNYPNNVGTMFPLNGGKTDGPAYMIGQPGTGPTLTFASITDGLSNTAMFSEYIRGKNGTKQLGLFQIYVSSVPWPNAPLTTNKYTYLINTMNQCKSTTTVNPSYDHKGMKWFNDACSQGGCYSHIMPPNLNACEFAGLGNGYQLRTMVGASSNHPGGVNVSFLDGSVHFIKNSVSPQTWWSIATMAGGEVIDANSL